MSFEGRADDLIEVDGDRIIRGWALDTSASVSPTEVTISLNSQVLATVPCDLFREDLREAGKPPEAAGFEWKVPSGLVFDSENRLTCRVGNLILPFYNPRTGADELWISQMEPEHSGPAGFDPIEPDDEPAKPELPLFRTDYELMFDPAFYREANLGLAADEDPLLHFDRIGRQAGWPHHWLFTQLEYHRLNSNSPLGKVGCYTICSVSSP